MRLKPYFSIRWAVGLLPLILAPHSSATRSRSACGDDGVHHAHAVGVVGGVLVAEEEDLAGELLADLPGEVGRAEAAVEAGHVGVGLLEAGVLRATRA